MLSTSFLSASVPPPSRDRKREEGDNRKKLMSAPRWESAARGEEIAA